MESQHLNCRREGETEIEMGGGRKYFTNTIIQKKKKNLRMEEQMEFSAQWMKIDPQENTASSEH